MSVRLPSLTLFPFRPGRVGDEDQSIIVLEEETNVEVERRMHALSASVRSFVYRLRNPESYSQKILCGSPDKHFLSVPPTFPVFSSPHLPLSFARLPGMLLIWNEGTGLV